MTKKKVQEKISHSCVECGRHATSEGTLIKYFYTTFNKFYKLSKTPLCKECCIKLSMTGKSLNINKLKEVLKFVDKPFFPDLISSSIESAKKSLDLEDIPDDDIKILYGETIILAYFRIIAMPQYTQMTFKHSPVEETENNINHSENIWGSTYNAEQVMWLNSYYEQMTKTHDIKTPQHVQNVIQITKITLKLQELLDLDNISEYSKLQKTYEEIMKSSGLRPIDTKNSAESSGLKTFSQIAGEIERDGYIKPKPIKYIQDDFDRQLLFYINYIRAIEGKADLINVPDYFPKLNQPPSRMESEEIPELIEEIAKRVDMNE